MLPISTGMAPLPCRRLLLAALCMLLAPEAAPAQSGGYTLETIALAGDLEPGGGTLETFMLLRQRDLDASGGVAFKAGTTSGEELILLHRNGALERVASNNPAYGNPGFPRLGQDGWVAWEWDPPPGGGVFPYPLVSVRKLDGVIQHVAFVGDGLVEPLVVVPRVDAMNALGDVLVHAQWDSGGGERRDTLELIRLRETTLQQVNVVSEWSFLPYGFVRGLEPGHTWPAALNEAGDVAFRAELEGGSVTQGLFLWTSGAGVEALLLPGDAMTGPPFGTFTAFADVIAMNGDREVAVEADWETFGSSSSGVFVVGPSAQRAVVLLGDELPGTGGHQFGGVAEGPPQINAAGDVTFTSYTGVGRLGLFVTRAHALERVALSGAVPDRPGVNFVDILGDAVLNDSGQLLLLAQTTAGEGLFLATPTAAPQVPLAPPLALGVLGALLLAHTRLVRSFQNGSRKVRFRIFPEPVRGSSSRKEIERGTL